jgi:hypothetical protein
VTFLYPLSSDEPQSSHSRTEGVASCLHIHPGQGRRYLGREELAVGDKLSVGIYSPERTLVDVIRLRHREGADVAWEALRRWIVRKGSKPATLLAMAKHFHGAERAVRDALSYSKAMVVSGRIRSQE